MKSTIKIFGIIAMVAIIGFGLTGCGEKEPLLRVVNQNNETIHTVEVWGLAVDDGLFTGLNIVTGSSQTFTLGTHWGRDYPATVTVKFGSNSASIQQGDGGVHLNGGKTATVTLSASGKLVQ
jgi:hypothetical protein